MTEETKSKVIGKCKQCGQCCKKIFIDMNFSDKEYIINKKEFLRNNFGLFIEQLIGCHLKANPYLDLSKANHINFYQLEDGRIRGHIYNIDCKALIKKKGKYFCKLHDNKPDICKNYPNINSTKLFVGCGYKIIKVKECKKKT